MKMSLAIALLIASNAFGQPGRGGQTPRQQQVQPPQQAPAQPPVQSAPGQVKKEEPKKPRTKVERLKKADEKAETRTLFLIDGKVKPADEIEKDEKGKTVAIYDEDPRDAVLGDIVEFEKPNLVSKWNPDPVTPIDVGWSYWVQRVWNESEMVVQPRHIEKDGTGKLGKPFVVRGIETKGLKFKSSTTLPGKFKIADVNRNKNGVRFFVMELQSESLYQR